MRTLFAALLLLSCVSCGRRPTAEFRGWWRASGGPDFQPCASSEQWLVTLAATIPLDTSMVFIASDSAAVRARPAPPDTGPQFSVVRGETSAVRPTDATRNYSQRLLVREIVELRPRQPGDCR